MSLMNLTFMRTKAGTAQTIALLRKDVRRIEKLLGRMMLTFQITKMVYQMHNPLWLMSK
jgi:hypothetical protein